MAEPTLQTDYGKPHLWIVCLLHDMIECKDTLHCLHRATKVNFIYHSKLCHQDMFINVFKSIQAGELAVQRA